MYSIFSYNKPDNINTKPFRPNDIKEELALSIEGLIAGFLVAGGLYILFQSRLSPNEISHVGSLSQNCILVVSISGGAFLLDYVVGTAIKSVKSHRALKDQSQKEPLLKQISASSLPNVKKD